MTIRGKKLWSLLRVPPLDILSVIFFEGAHVFPFHKGGRRLGEKTARTHRGGPRKESILLQSQASSGVFVFDFWGGLLAEQHV